MRYTEKSQILGKYTIHVKRIHRSKETVQGKLENILNEMIIKIKYNKTCRIYWRYTGKEMHSLKHIDCRKEKCHMGIGPPTFSLPCGYGVEQGHCRARDSFSWFLWLQAPPGPHMAAWNIIPKLKSDCVTPSSKPTYGSPLLQGKIQNGPCQAGLLWPCPRSPWLLMPCPVPLCYTQLPELALEIKSFFFSLFFVLEIGWTDKMQDSQLNLSFR